MSKRWWRRLRAEQGQVLLITAFGLVALLGVAGLAIDAGVARVQFRSAQNAADAAALAGADDLPGNSATAINNATAYTAQNGFTNGLHNVTVTVHNPPQSGAHQGDSNSIAVTISEQVPTFLLGVLHRNSIAIKARAVATSTGTVPCGLCILSPNASQALYINNSGGVTVTGNNIAVDSTASDAAYITDAARVGASAIRVVGGAQAKDSAVFSPPPNTGVKPVPDPLANVPVPSVSGPNYGSVSVGSGTKQISPGIYSSLTLKDTGTLSLAPGTYVVTGPITARDYGRLVGSGVTIYFACASYPTPCQPGELGGQIDFADYTSYQISAPTSGPYQGLAIFYDRNNASPLKFRDASGASLNGTIYAKSSDMTVSDAAGNSQIDSLVVVNTLHIPDGTSSLKLSFDKNQNYQAVGPGSSKLTE